MAKIKLTLSIDEEVLSKAKVRTAAGKKSISEMVEELLESVGGSFSEEIKRLGLKEKYVSFEEVTRKRKKSGLSAGAVIRELRDERAKKISGY